MLIDKTAETIWSKNNRKWYESKGYKFTKYGYKFEVKVKDLMDGSDVKVNVQCDNCKKPLTIEWKQYNNKIINSDKYLCIKCSKIKKSFEQWCIENNRQDILDRWDYELNVYKPNQIGYASDEKYWIKCPRKLHKSKLYNIHWFTNRAERNIKCEKCNSFAQWGIDNLGDDFLEKYWDYDKNIDINPWEINHGSSKTMIWIKCQEKDYHGSYEISCNNFMNNYRCPYCINHKVHKLDSLGCLYPNVFKYWSDKNKKSPYEYSPHSQQKVYWKCPNGKHKDFKRSINSSQNYDFRCSLCDFSKGEKRIEKWLILNNIIFEPQKTFDGLIGLGNGLLSYDFYLPNQNLLIEYQGEFHKQNVVPNQTKEQFKYQQEHDKRKKQYTIDNNINFLEIWYWNFDNIESILEKELNNNR